MSEWKDSYESSDDHLKDLRDMERDRIDALKRWEASDEGTRMTSLKLQKLNMGICIYRDFGRDQDKWPAWIRAQAAELGIE